MSIEIITTILLALGALTIIILERIFPYTKGLKFFREGFWLDLVWYTIIQSYVLKILIFDFIILPIDQYYGLSRLQLISDWSLLAQVLFFLFIHDFYIYWFHRFQHYSPIFWRTHEAHHSNKEVDWLAGSRSHVVEIIINQTVEFAPIILLGANPAVVPIKALLDALWGMFIHANIDIKMGKLQYFINGPEMHQWHHADYKEVYHANFATKFAFFDWIFGTAYLPGYKPIKFGLYYDYPREYLLQHIFSFYRFNVAKLEANPRWKAYIYLRQNMIKSAKNLIYHHKDQANTKTTLPLPPSSLEQASEPQQNIA